jgi:LacI family transcriptional regulator
VLVADSAESPEDELPLVNEIRRRCDALVLCAPRMTDAELVALAATARPLVLINRVNAGVDAPSLSIDYRRGIQDLAQLLADLGHRHLVYVEGPQESVSNRERNEGLAEFVQRVADVRIDRIHGGATSEDGLAAAAAVHESGASAALAFNDLVAIGLMGGLAERGVRVPRDISVTGFDDIPFARYSAPALTTVSVPHEDLGTQAWDRMKALIAGEVPRPDVIFRPQLEVRASTGVSPG